MSGKEALSSLYVSILTRLFKFPKLVSILHPTLLLLKLYGSAVTLLTLVASNLGIFAVQYSQNMGNNMHEDLKNMESVHFSEI